MAEFLVWGWLCIMRTGWHGEGLRASCRSTVFGLYLSTVCEKLIHRTSWKRRSRKFTPLVEVVVKRDGVVLCVCKGGAALAPQFTT
jgi:hypothetical protein